MLQQTRVSTVIPYFDKWLKKFPDFKTLANASEEEVLKKLYYLKIKLQMKKMQLRLWICYLQRNVQWTERNG